PEDRDQHGRRRLELVVFVVVRLQRLVLELLLVLVEQRQQLLGRRREQRRRRIQRELVADLSRPASRLRSRVASRAPRYTVRLDPWSADYDSGLQLVESDEETWVEVDTAVEVAPDDWRPIRPGRGPRPATLAFVDGVRRIEHRLLLESDDERLVFGLLGSYAVGATCVDGRARVAHEQVERVACVGGGVALSRLEAPVPGGRQTLVFTPQATPENTPIAPVQCLQNSMRRREAALGEALAAEGSLVFLDGPLTFLSESTRPVVGFVKRLLKAYLPAPQGAVLRALAEGERSPLFLIRSQAPR